MVCPRWAAEKHHLGSSDYGQSITRVGELVSRFWSRFHRGFLSGNCGGEGELLGGGWLLIQRIFLRGIEQGATTRCNEERDAPRRKDRGALHRCNLEAGGQPGVVCWPGGGGNGCRVTGAELAATGPPLSTTGHE